LRQNLRGAVGADRDRLFAASWQVSRQAGIVWIAAAGAERSTGWQSKPASRGARMKTAFLCASEGLATWLVTGTAGIGDGGATLPAVAGRGGGARITVTAVLMPSPDSSGVNARAGGPGAACARPAALPGVRPQYRQRP
jgi:hypothetical protein